MQVERLRRERNEARSDAMRWLEEQQQSNLALPSPSPSNFITASGSTTDVIAAGEVSRGAGLSTRSQSARSLSTTSGVPSATTTTIVTAAVAGSAPPATAVFANGGSSSGVAPGGAGVAGVGGAAPAPGGGVASGAAGGGGAGVVAVDYKAAIAIAKLKAKVERLRKERDEAEKQAASWLRNQQRKLGQDSSNSNSTAAATATSAGGDPDSSSHTRNRESSSAAAAAAAANAAGGPVVASLKAESLRLKKELHESREEAKRWRSKAAGSRGGGGGLDGGEVEFGESSGVSGSAFPRSDDALLHEGKVCTPPPHRVGGTAPSVCTIIVEKEGRRKGRE